MSEPISDQVYLTFSEDWRYAFVERGALTRSPADVQAWLDRRLRDFHRPAVPRIRRWSAHLAQVLEPERWDEGDGRRLNSQVPGSRVLWRVDVSRALELEPIGQSNGRRLIQRLAELHADGLLDQEELSRASLLHSAVEEVETERRQRQELRLADAPRAPVRAAEAALLARLVLILMGALGARPDEDGDEVSRALQGMQLRIAVEEERQVVALRAELDALGSG